MKMIGFITLLVLTPFCIHAQLEGEFYFDIIDNQTKDFTHTMRETGARSLEIRCFDLEGNLLGKAITSLGGRFQTDGSFKSEQVSRIIFEYDPPSHEVLANADRRGGMSICFQDTYAKEQPLQNGQATAFIVEAHDLYFTKLKFKSVNTYDYILTKQPIELIRM